MRFAGNVIWFLLCGGWTAILWLLGSVIFAISIIGLPLSRAAIEMAKMTAFPFGKDVVHIRELDQKELSATTAMTGTIGFIFNILWACTFGIALFLSYLISGLLLCLLIITFPLGLQAFKLAGISFWPIGRRVVTKELAQVTRERNAEAKLDALRSSQ